LEDGGQTTEDGWFNICLPSSVLCRLQLTFSPPPLRSAQSTLHEDSHGQGHHHQGQARLQRRYRLLLRDEEEFPHDDRQADQEEVRPGRQEARRIPRIQDQVTTRSVLCGGARRAPFALRAAVRRRN